MGLSVVLESETGESLDRFDDEKNLFHRLLPDPDDATYQLIRFIDWYGNTMFNRPQMDAFIGDLNKLATKVKTEEETELLRRVIDFAHRVREEPHLYLKFYGD
jgi:hypothetical protein